MVGEADLGGFFGGEVARVLHAQPVGLVGIADQRVGPMWDQHRMVDAGDGGEVREVITATQVLDRRWCTCNP